MAKNSPIDTSVQVPAAVKAAADRANELLSQHAAPSPFEAPAQNGEEEQGEEVQVNAEGQQPAAQVEAPAPQQVEEKPPTDWEQKYNSMRGRVEALARELNTVRDQNRILQEQLDEMDAQDAPKTYSKQQLITDDERELFGDDFLTVAGKRAREELNPELEQLRNEVSQMKNQFSNVSSSVTRSARETMFASLATEVPDWQELNQDQGFLSWLALPDAFSGAIRHELLEDAYKKNDGSRVVSFFKGFLAEEAAIRPAPAEPAFSNAPGKPQATGKVPLTQFAAPGRAKTAAAPSTRPVEKPIITRAQIAKFYADATQGKYRANPEQYKQYESLIFEAERDGRVR